MNVGHKMTTKKYKSFKDYYDQADPAWRKGWDDCMRTLRTYLQTEQGAAPKTMTYAGAMDRMEKYVFEGKSIEYWFEDELFDNGELDIDD